MSWLCILKIYVARNIERRLPMRNLPAVTEKPFSLVRIGRTKENVFPVEDFTSPFKAVLTALKETAKRRPNGDVFAVLKNDCPFFTARGK